MPNSDALLFRGRMREEIREEYSRMVSADAVIKTEALCEAVVHRHMPAVYQMPNADEAQVFVGALQVSVRPIAIEFMNQIGRELDAAHQSREAGQLRFVGGGFESDILQDRYAFERDGERVHAPLESMSREEVLEKANEYRRMAEGNMAHYRELMRYASWKFDHEPAALNLA